MALDFSLNGYEELFRQALARGIDLFCGAGFSVESFDRAGRALPVGSGLLRELKAEFPAVGTYTSLPRACTTLLRTDKGSFYSYLEERFTVERFSDAYKALLDIPVRSIYTTNIDDLFFKLYESSDRALYLNDRSVRGDEYVGGAGEESGDRVNYFPLHGCVRTPGDYVFGAMEIASAFSQRGLEQSWASLAKDAEQDAILFWGWNFEDSGPIEAMYGRGGGKTDANTQKWALLHSRRQEMVGFLQALNFNIIIGDTADMLQYLREFGRERDSQDQGRASAGASSHRLDRFLPPPRDKAPVYPLRSFFCDYTPRWSYVYSGSIPRLSHYKEIANHIAAQKNVIFSGIRGSGKTTLMMQLIADVETSRPKHYMTAPTLETVRSYLEALEGAPGLLFIDDCFRDTNAVLEAFQASNVQVVCCDRDFNYERQYHKIQHLRFQPVDITEITQTDAQAVLDVIPRDLRRGRANTKKFQKDPTLPNLLITAMRAHNFKYLERFYESDPLAAKVFLMICYVHSCGVPCSFDMVYSFLGDDVYTWQEMMEIVQRAGKLIRECEDSSDYFGSFDIDYSLQDYYQCRSRLFAEKILESVPQGDEMFADMLSDFADYVPPFKICAYDKFKRSGYDADLAVRAFTDPDDGREFYETCVLRDESEYSYQQAAIYFFRMGRPQEAFHWIDRARDLAHYNRFSIDSTYANLYFHANLGIDDLQCREALNILIDCCTSDKRKSIHFATFAGDVLEYAEKGPDDDDQAVLAYINKALEFIEEGLDDKNIALQTKNKWQLKGLKRELLDAKRRFPGSEEP